MDIVVLDTLFKQSREDQKKTPVNIMQRICKEFERLNDLEEKSISLDKYLKNHHGIKMQGSDKIFKYELTGGGRILYTHCQNLPWLERMEPSTVVLLRYSSHDNQGSDAKKYDLNKRRDYYYLKDIIDTIDEFQMKEIDSSDITLDDYNALFEIFTEDFPQWHDAFVVRDEKKYLSLSPEEMDKILSPEQYECIDECIREKGPALIIGGAGTGKTLIGVHLLIDFSKTISQKKVCYFTQSQELRTKVQTWFLQYDIYDEIPENVHFNDINEYCLKILGKKKRNLAGFKEFQVFLDKDKESNKLLHKASLTPMEIWAEIRGVIKGSMSSDWKRVGTFDQNETKGDIQKLIANGYLRRDPSDGRKLTLVDTVEDTIENSKNDPELSVRDIENINRIIEYFSSFDPSIRVLPFEEYQRIPEENTTIEKDKKKIVWDICSRYDKYLQDNNLYDDNDLIREVFAKGLSDDDKYEFTVVDEVQDYTELQLFLIRSLTNGDRIVFAGDEHQNINPASFSESRMRSLFYNNSKESPLKIIRLKKNYRCQQGIIDITNELATVRRKTIARKAAEMEEDETSKREKIATPTRLQFSSENLDSCISTILQYPKAVILVANEDTKEKILERIKGLKETLIEQIGLDKYNAREHTSVYTVAEIKGMEYEYVLGYNLVGAFTDVWQRIFKEGRGKTKFRYYYNLLYVAMTRARYYFCIIDKQLSNELESNLSFKYVSDFDPAELYLNQLIDDEKNWLEQAEKYEKEGKFQDAIFYYNYVEADQSNIYRCRYKMALQDKDFDTAARISLLMESSEKIEECIEEIESEDVKKLATIMLHLSNGDSNYGIKRANISMLVDKCFDGYVESEIQQARRVLTKAMIKCIHDQTQGISFKLN